MPKLIDADKLKQHYAWWDNEDKKIFDTIVDLQPTVDAEPVVRCEDCKWQITAYCPMPSWERKDNHYCYKGAKMDEVEE